MTCSGGRIDSKLQQLCIAMHVSYSLPWVQDMSGVVVLGFRLTLDGALHLILCFWIQIVVWWDVTCSLTSLDLDSGPGVLIEYGEDIEALCLSTSWSILLRGLE